MRKSSLYLLLLSAVLDLLAIYVGLLVAYRLRSEGLDLYFWPFTFYARLAFLSLPIWLVILASQGLYNPRSLPVGWNAVGRFLVGLLSGWGIVLILLYLSRSPEASVFPRLIIGYGLLTTAVFGILGRLIIGWLRAILYYNKSGLVRTVVIAQTKDEEFARDLLLPKHGRELIAILINGELTSKLSSTYKHGRFDELIVADPRLNEQEILSLLDWAENHNCAFAVVPSFLSVRATNVEIGTLAGTPIMYFKQTPLDGWGRIFKRLFDIVLVLPTMIILLPLYILLFLINKLTSVGPAVFAQARIGQDGQRFYVHKFRSMYGDWQKRFPDIKDWSSDEENDPRVTPLGRLMRKTNLDELPQLWDVFIGAMSLVGPRPEQPKYVEKFAQEIPGYMKRHFVKSGLTGWAQINGLRGDTSIPERVKYDIYYIENWSIWFDLRIIISTFVMLMRQLLGFNS